MADKIKDIQSRLMNNLHGSDELAAAASYIPLVGWLVGKAKKEDDFCQFHSDQSFKLNLVIVALYLIIWFLEHFPLTSFLFGEGAILNELTGGILIVSIILFLVISAFAAFKALSEERWEVPYLHDTLQYIRDEITGKSHKKNKQSGRKSDTDDE